MKYNWDELIKLEAEAQLSKLIPLLKKQQENWENITEFNIHNFSGLLHLVNNCLPSDNQEQVAKLAKSDALIIYKDFSELIQVHQIKEIELKQLLIDCLNAIYSISLESILMVEQPETHLTKPINRYYGVSFHGSYHLVSGADLLTLTTLRLTLPLRQTELAFFPNGITIDQLMKQVQLNILTEIYQQIKSYNRSTDFEIEVPDFVDTLFKLNQRQIKLV